MADSSNTRDTSTKDLSTETTTETDPETVVTETTEVLRVKSSASVVNDDGQEGQEGQEEDASDTISSQIVMSQVAESVASLAKREVVVDRNELVDPYAVPAIDTSAYNKAVKAIKKNLTERTVMNQLQTIWLMYEDCQRILNQQNSTITKYKKLIEKLDEEANNDKRVMKAIYYADRNRTARQEMEEINVELERALKDRDELQIPTMNSRIKQLVKDLDQAKRGTRYLNQLQEKFIDLEFSYNKCQSQLRTMKSELAAEAAEKIKKIQDMLNSVLEKSQAEITAIVSEKNMVIGTLRRKLTKYSMDTADMKEQMKLLKTELINCEQALQTSETQLKIARSKNTQIEIKNRELEAIMEVNKTNILQMVNTKKQHDKDLHAAKSEIVNQQAMNEKLSGELSRATYEMNGLIRLNKSIEDEKVKLLKDLAQQQSKADEVMTQFNMNKKDMEKMNKQIKNDSEAMKSLTTKCENLAKKINTMRTDANNRESLLKCKDKEQKYCQDLNERLTSELNAKDNQIKANVFNIEKLYNNVLELQEMVKSCEKSSHTLQTFAEYLEKKHDILEEQLAEEVKEVFTVQKKNAMLDVKMKIINDMYDQRTEEVARNTSQIKDLVMENRNLGFRVGEKQKEVERYEHKLAVKTRDCSMLETHVHQLKLENQLKQNSINQLMSKNQDLTEKLKFQILNANDIERMRDFQQSKADMRCAELILLETRMTMAEKKLDIGTRELHARNHDCSILITEIKNLRRKLNIRDKEVENHRVLKERHTHVVRQLTLSECKLVALEKMRPTMVHPHRQLQATDTTSYDLHVKINHLTQQLIRKTTEVAQKEDLIIKKTKLFLEFKTMMLRRGDPKETTEEVWRLKKLLQSNDKEIKCLRAELKASLHTASEARNTLKGEQQKLDATKHNLIKEKKIFQRKNFASISDKKKDFKNKTPMLPPIKQPKDQQLKSMRANLRKNIHTASQVKVTLKDEQRKLGATK